MSRRRFPPTFSFAWGLLAITCLAAGCSSEPGPPSEVIEIETIEIIDLDEPASPATPAEPAEPAEKSVTDKAAADVQSAKAAADQAKATADQEIEAAGRTVSPPPTAAPVETAPADQSPTTPPVTEDQAADASS